MHFAGSDPLKVDRRAISIKNGVTFDATRIRVNRDGDIIRQPLLFGKPCFGVITAYLRHGVGHPTKEGQLAKVSGSRCGRCGVREACIKVNQKRMLANFNLSDAVRQWYAAGGSKLFRGKELPSMLAPWANIVKQAIEADFKSVNDKRVVAYWAEQDDGFPAREAARKREIRKIRQELWKRYEMTRYRRHNRSINHEPYFVGDDLDLIDALHIERSKRIRSMKKACRSSEPGTWMSALSDGSIRFLVSAWAARILANSSRSQPHVGREMVRTTSEVMMKYEWCEGYAFKRLLVEVEDYLERIDWIDGDPITIRGILVWSKFDILAAGRLVNSPPTVPRN